MESLPETTNYQSTSCTYNLFSKTGLVNYTGDQLRCIIRERAHAALHRTEYSVVSTRNGYYFCYVEITTIPGTAVCLTGDGSASTLQGSATSTKN